MWIKAYILSFILMWVPFLKSQHYQFLFFLYYFWDDGTLGAYKTFLIDLPILLGSIESLFRLCTTIQSMVGCSRIHFFLRSPFPITFLKTHTLVKKIITISILIYQQPEEFKILIWRHLKCRIVYIIHSIQNNFYIWLSFLYSVDRKYIRVLIVF